MFILDFKTVIFKLISIDTMSFKIHTFKKVPRYKLKNRMKELLHQIMAKVDTKKLVSKGGINCQHILCQQKLNLIQKVL